MATSSKHAWRHVHQHFGSATHCVAQQPSELMIPEAGDVHKADQIPNGSGHTCSACSSETGTMLGVVDSYSYFWAWSFGFSSTLRNRSPTLIAAHPVKPSPCPGQQCKCNSTPRAQLAETNWQHQLLACRAHAAFGQQQPGVTTWPAIAVAFDVWFLVFSDLLD